MCVARSLEHPKHGNLFTSVAPPSLQRPGSTKVKKSRSKKATAKAGDISNNSHLDLFGFTSTPSPVAPKKRSVAGISTKLASMGLKKPKKTPAACTEQDIDHSLYLWPNYLFPALDNATIPDNEAFANLGLELVGIEHDPRDLILDLKECYIEVNVSV